MLDLHHSESCIVLPPIILDQMKAVSGGPLKVYIYLCARYKGQPFSASIAQLKAATGLEDRSVIAAVKVLLDKKLITRISGRGKQPNHYGILLPMCQETAAPPARDTTAPSAGLKLATPPAETMRRATTPEPIIAFPSTKSGQASVSSPAPTQATIPALIATSFRPINAHEDVQLKNAFPDEVVLREKLERFKQKGDNVGPDMQIGFFIQALRFVS